MNHETFVPCSEHPRELGGASNPGAEPRVTRAFEGVFAPWPLAVAHRVTPRVERPVPRTQSPERRTHTRGAA